MTYIDGLTSHKDQSSSENVLGNHLTPTRWEARRQTGPDDLHGYVELHGIASQNRQHHLHHQGSINDLVAKKRWRRWHLILTISLTSCAKLPEGKEKVECNFCFCHAFKLTEQVTSHRRAGWAWCCPGCRPRTWGIRRNPRQSTGRKRWPSPCWVRRWDLQSSSVSACPSVEAKPKICLRRQTRLSQNCQNIPTCLDAKCPNSFKTLTRFTREEVPSRIRKPGGMRWAAGLGRCSRRWGRWSWTGAHWRSMTPGSSTWAGGSSRGGWGVRLARPCTRGCPAQVTGSSARPPEPTQNKRIVSFVYRPKPMFV